MALNIKNSEAHRMAHELASLRGVSVTSAVTEAIREELVRQKRRKRGQPLSKELLQIGKLCAQHMTKPLKSRDHATLLYDKKGLPG